LLLAAVLIAVAACAVNPATGERQLSFIGEGQEIEMGRQSDPSIVAQYGLYPDSAIQRYVRDLGLRLAAVSERPELPWTFRVLDDPSINAFALPGGFIYVTRGILGHLESEAQLAGVLGHEIGHVTARHSVNQMSRAQLATLGFGAAMIFSEDARRFGDVAQAGLGLAFLKFGRDDEDQSDELGVRYMTRLGYDPRELAGVMQMLGASGRLASGGGRLPEWQSTHPDPENRVQSILARVEREGLVPADPTVRGPEFVARLADLTYGPNPREGYVEGGVFHHPDLAFRFTPPAGWEVANLKQAVLAGPSEQDAIFELTVADGDPSSLASSFASQQGVRTSRPVNRTVNGLPTVVMDFVATGEGGELEGQVAFVRHADLTFRLLGYAPIQRWPTREGAIESTIRSFAEETSPDVLAVQPARIDLVALSGAEPFDAFAERYPSTIPVERVALLNQVDVGGILRGAYAKRVLGGR
jgi:predicted Zn-dependent protease